jgi:ADP-dependent NAD(P)H-hydrate dehydratase / NAD(P)H-hydrate epimerase
MQNLSGPILTAAQMRAAEQAVIDGGTRVDVLMGRAGTAIAEAVWRFGGGKPTLFLCGPGNNGGDGYVAARLLHERGLDVRIAALREPKSPAAVAARQLWTGPVEALGDATTAPVVVDCLFGTGLARPLERSIVAALDRHFHSGTLRIAVDIPSGIGTDDGALMGFENVRHPADLTLALGALKPAHVLQPGAACCGQILCLDIGVPVASDVMMSAHVKLPVSPTPSANKFDRTVVVVAGGMPGAAQLAARAASRLAGYTVLATETVIPNPVASIVQRSFDDALRDPRFTTYVIGPGLGLGADAAARLAALLETDHRLVIDADGLNLLVQLGLDRVKQRRAPTILTPHEGEFRRLFGDLPGSKIDRAKAASERWGATVIYKGSDTLVAGAGTVRMTRPAPAWLATAGTGDVLAGLAGGFLSFVEQPEWAALAAAQLHGAVARHVGPGLIADDMQAHIGTALRANGYA